jgi:hypothetical protein
MDETMSTNSYVSDGDFDAHRHLSDLRALHMQLRETTLALATEEAPAFLECLAMLELHCALLGQSFRETAHSAGPSSLCRQAVPELAKQIQDEHLELARGNYRFSALLRRRQRSVELLLRHYQSLSREVLPGSESPPAMRRISAEV